MTRNLQGSAVASFDLALHDEPAAWAEQALGDVDFQLTRGLLGVTV